MEDVQKAMEECFAMKDLQFEAARWEKYLTLEGEDVIIYRQLERGIYKYLAYGTFRDIEPEVLLRMSTDHDHRLSWDEYTLGVTLVSRNDHYSVVHWESAMPWPLKNRDYVYARKIERRDGLIAIASKALVSSPVSSQRGYVRVEDFFSLTLMRKKGNDTEFWFQYFDDMKFPKTLLNWAASVAVPKMVRQMQEVCLKYPRDRLEIDLEQHTPLGKRRCKKDLTN